MSRSSRRGLVALAGAMVAVLVFAVYSPWSTRTFLRDDHVLVEDESAPYREAPLGALFLQRFWPESAGLESKAPYYRPLVLASFRVDLSLGGTPLEFHFTNVFLHALVTLLVAVCATRLGAPGAAAVAASLLFGLAPRLTECVAWVSGRTDVLAAAFALGAIALSPDVPVRAGWRSPGRDLPLAALSGLLLFGALASKEVAVAAVVALVVLAWLRRADAPGSRAVLAARLVLGIVAPTAVWAVLRARALVGSHVEIRDLGAWGRAATVFEAVGRYAETTVLPLWPRTLMGVVGVPDLRRVALGVATTLVLSAALVAHRRRRVPKPLADGTIVGLVLAAAALAPVLHVLPVAIGGNVACDRFLYFPLAGLLMAGAVASERLSARGASLAIAFAVVLAIPFAIVTRARARDYEDETRFWVVAVEHGDRASVGALNALGTMVADAGFQDLGCRVIREGLARAERTGQGASPSARRIVEGLARCLALAGKYDEAVQVAERGVATFPTHARGWLVLGLARLHAGDLAGAEASFVHAATMDRTLTKAARPLLAGVRAARDLEGPRAGEGAAGAREERQLESLVMLGRPRDAEALAYDLVAREDLPRPLRAKALRLLVETGDVGRARGAVEKLGPSKALLALLVEREERHARVGLLLPRIERLATP